MSRSHGEEIAGADQSTRVARVDIGERKPVETTALLGHRFVEERGHERALMDEEAPWRVGEEPVPGIGEVGTQCTLDTASHVSLVDHR